LYVGVVRGLQPLRNLARQIAERSPELLNPVESDQVPVEMQDVVAALNDLLARLALTLEGEQRFTANAAHELVTPLAAIKTEVQLCQRQMQDDVGRAMLGRIAQRVDRAIHSVEQLLTLARVDPDAPVVLEEVDLRVLLTDVVAESAHLASDRGLEIEIPSGDPLPLQANGEALSILLRNLLVNAFRYAREGSAVAIRLREEGPIELEICNDCEPLSGDEFDQICERFYRVPGSNGLGAGLGLSIVSRIAEQHGADFSVGPRADGSGFCARLRFPA
jgi:signal transduction histidine kinase